MRIGLKNDAYWLSHGVKSVQIRSYFWSVFSCIRTEYGEIQSISPYSVRIRENTDQQPEVLRSTGKVAATNKKSLCFS